MATIVDTFDSVEAVINEHRCIHKMKAVIRDCCGADSSRFINKIMARFIISSKTLGRESHSIIPEFSHKPSVEKFEQELIDQFKSVDIPRMRKELSEIRDEYLAKTYSDKGRVLDPRIEIRENTGETMIIEYEFPAKPGNAKGKGTGKGKAKVKGTRPFDVHMPVPIYEKLVALCEHSGKAAYKYIFCLWLRYNNTIMCGGRDSMHWCCSEDLFQILHEELHCKVELFASPINSHPDSLIYGSLFHDTDRHFGSMGNYAQLISEKRLTGIMQAHPPAIESIQHDFVSRAIAEMSLEDRPLGFLAFLVNWEDAAYYKLARDTTYCKRFIRASDYEQDLAEPYFTFYSPLFDEDIPIPENDRIIIVVFANKCLWEPSTLRNAIEENFPETTT